jgi:hypothetical protein
MGDAALGAASVGSERDCARACCDVPSCDAYAYASGLQGSNCFFVGNVTHVYRNHAFNAGVNVRVL